MKSGHHIFAITLLLICHQTSAAGMDPAMSLLSKKQAAISHDPMLLERMMVEGEDRSRLCVVCHGENGNSEKQAIPKLASQNPAYIIEQFEKFSDGRRHNFVMQNLAKNFTPEDMVNLAVYYSRQERVPSAFDSQLAGQGREIYSAQCVKCHGDNGMGAKGYANIAGQHPAYVEFTLTNFRDKTNDRQSEEMETYASNLSDDDIAALAAYIAELGRNKQHLSQR